MYCHCTFLLFFISLRKVEMLHTRKFKEFSFIAHSVKTGYQTCKMYGVMISFEFGVEASRQLHLNSTRLQGIIDSTVSVEPIIP